MIVSEIKVESFLMLGNAQVDLAFGAIELGARLQLIKRCADDRGARGRAGCSVIGTTQESPEAVASDGQVSRWRSITRSA